MTLIVLAAVSLMGAFLGRGVGFGVEILGPSTGGWIGAVSALLTGVAALAPGDQRLRAAGSRLEMLVVAMVSGGLAATSGQVTRTLPVVLGVGLGLGVRALVNATVRDISLLTRITDDGVGRRPLDRIRARVVVFGIILASLVGFALGAEAGLASLDRPAVQGVLASVVGWFVVGVAGTGALTWRARRWRWRQDSVDVDERVAVRWGTGVAVMVVGVAILMVTLPIITQDSSSIPGRSMAGAGGVGQWIADGLGRLGDITIGESSDSAQGEPGSGQSPAEQFADRAGRPPAWVGDVALIVILGAVLGWVIRASRRVRFVAPQETRGSGGWAKLRAMLMIMLRDLAALVRRVMRWFSALRGRPRARLAGRNGDPSPSGAGQSSGWKSNDLNRRRIGSAFARMAAHEPHQRGETPLELADRVGGRSDQGAALRLARSYLGARYSSHLIEVAQADEAERSADTVVGYFDSEEAR